jgi:hypothetical protein
MAAVAFLVPAGSVATAAPPGPISLRVSGAAAVDTGRPRDLSVTIGNDGAVPVLVLPNLVRLRFEGIGAEYVPYPGPPIDPWGDTRELAPGATATVEFRNASDKRGVWRLPPARYRITALYEVPPDLAPPATIAEPGRVWRGRLESPPARMTVN